MSRKQWISDKSYLVTNAHEMQSQEATSRIPYDRPTLVAVLVFHQQLDSTACNCGWGPLGASHAEHVADVYEKAMGA